MLPPVAPLCFYSMALSVLHLAEGVASFLSLSFYLLITSLILLDSHNIPSTSILDPNDQKKICFWLVRQIYLHSLSGPLLYGFYIYLFLAWNCSIFKLAQPTTLKMWLRIRPLILGPLYYLSCNTVPLHWGLLRQFYLSRLALRHSEMCPSNKTRTTLLKIQYYTLDFNQNNSSFSVSRIGLVRVEIRVC